MTGDAWTRWRYARLLPADLDRLEESLVAAAARLPALGTAGIKNVVNGPDAYTPDGRCLMGPVPGLRDFHVLAGFSILKGSLYGRVIGVIAAGLSAIAHISTMRVYPIWSMTIIVICVLVIYALTVHGDELKPIT